MVNNTAILLFFVGWGRVGGGNEGEEVFRVFPMINTLYSTIKTFFGYVLILLFKFGF